MRKAVLNDVPGIFALIEAYAVKGIMLHRTGADICDNLRDFFVYEDEQGSGVIGAGALHICSEDTGEIRSLAVKEGATGRGIGTEIVKACLAEARAIGIKKVFALTYKPLFFHKLNFKAIKKEVLPQKIWRDCIRCVKFPNCDENAVIIDISKTEIS